MHRFVPEFKALACCAYWSSNGELFVFGSPHEGVWNLWAVTQSAWPLPRFDSRPTQLTSGPISFRSSAASSDGKQIFAVGETPRGELSVFDPKSGLFGKYGSGISAGFTDFSRDGRWMAYVSHPDGTLWRSRIDGSERLQLTFPPMGPILNPKWSPDGRFIVFTGYKDWEPKIYLISADGGASLLLLSDDFKANDPTWSPDGRSIAYGGPSIFDGTATEVRILNLDTKQSKTVSGSQGLFSPRWSPDGRYLAAKSADKTQLFLYSFQSGGWSQLPAPKPPKGTSVDWQYWSHDSRYLYFMIGLNVYRMGIPEGSAELAASAENIDIICPVFAWGYWFGLTPDDRVLVLRDRSVEEIYALDLEYR
jgi:Tol biopolymer transport system component